MRRRLQLATCAAAYQLSAAAAHAEPATPPSPAGSLEGQRLWVQAHSETYLRLFQRALLPGPNGSLIETRTQAPLHEYLSVRAAGIAPPWGLGSVDAEVSAWGTWVFGEEPARRLDGDITTAFVQQRLGPGSLRLGRQNLSSAAAQYVRFDGARARVDITPELGVDMYAGWTVLPRWDARLGYQHLGSAADSLVRDPDALDPLDRSGSSVAGGRVHLDTASGIRGGLSFHDQREAHELGRRNLGLDLQLSPFPDWSVAANSTLDTDSWQLADARVWVDVFPSPKWSVAAEYLRTQPALFLSRQSVLSVFGTSAFDEWGSAITYRPFRHVSLSGSAYAQLTEEDLGMRSEAKLRATLDEGERVRLQVGHTRLLGVANGYHALRTSVGYTLSAQLQSSAEVYFYLYDELIESSRYSLVQAANISFRPDAAWSLLWGVSLAQTPYAQADLQSLLRLTHDLDNR